MTGGVLDGELAALAWLLVEDGVPLIVAGPVPRAVRAGIATALLDAVPERPWVVLDAEDAPPDLDQLAATIRGGVTPALLARDGSLRDLLERLTEGPAALPEDAIRRLGLVLILGERAGVVRVEAAHYLRPTERDANGHLQRRPPAVLATRDPGNGLLEHFAWGIAGELGDRVDRSQADLEERQEDRARTLAAVAGLAPAERPAALAAARAAEPERRHAPREHPERPAAPRSPLTDPHLH